MSGQSLHLRTARDTDLDAINRIVEAAVMTWQLPERVKRLALPSYRYTKTDLVHQHILVAEEDEHIVGVAAWEEADPADTPVAQRAGLLHGIYVDPARHGTGIGRKLYTAVLEAMCSAELAGLLVKAQTDAVPFFEALGLQSLDVTDSARDYARRFWKACNKQ